MSAPRRRSRLFTTSAFGALALAALWAAPAQAQLVQGATPAQSNGTGPTIDQSVPNTTTVTLGGSRTVIDWDKFDINGGDTANFVFANRSDIVLNRVGGAASTINGNLNGTIGSAGGTAGGNIWIYNANGVVIGANARISTGGLLVTTAAIDRATDSSAGGFLDGSSTQFGFTGASSDAGITVRNGAQITSHGGAIALVSTSVTTEAGSSISAQDGGNVLYGAAAKYKISFRPTGADDLDLLSFEVASGADGTASTANGGDLLSLSGNTSGNRVFAALVSKTNVFSRLLSTGTVTASTAALDETGAIVLTTNHNIVNGAAAATAVANNGGADLGLANAGSLTAPAITVRSSDSITGGGGITAAGGAVDLAAENGVLWLDSAAITAGTLNARAAASLKLTGGSNQIDKVTGLTSGDYINFYSYTGTGTEIAGDIVAPGNVNLNVGGASGSGVIRAAYAELSGDGAYNLDTATTLDFVYAINHDLTVNSTGDLNIALTGTANNLGNRVFLNAANGAIHQSAGTGVLNGTVIAGARDGIDLSQNNLFSQVFVSSLTGATIDVKGVNSFDIGGLTTGVINVTSGGTVGAGSGSNIGTLNINAAAININQAALGAVNFGNLTATSGDIAIATDSTVSFSGAVTAASGHDVSITSNLGAINQTAGTIRGRQVHMSAGGSIVQGQSATITSTGMGTDSFVAGDDLILAGANNMGLWGLTLGWGSGSDVTLRSANRIYFDGGATPIGTLTLIADNGNIQQGSAAFTANTLIASATQSIELGTSQNNSIAHLGNISSSTGDVSLRMGANTPVSIDGTISSATKVLFTARGAVTGSGTIAAPQTYLDTQTGGTINIAGSTTLIGLGTGGGDLTVNATGGLAVNTTVAGNNRAITLNAAGGDILQTGGSVVAVSLLTLNASGDIDFGAGSYMSGVIAGSTGGGDITLRNAGSTNLAVNTTGAVTLLGDSYDMSGGGHAGSLTATLGGDLTLDMGSVGSFGALSAGGDLSIALDGDIKLTDTVTAGNSLLLNSRNGAIVQTGGTISLGTGFVFQAATGIDLNQTGNHLGNHLGTSSVIGANGSNVVIRGDWVNAGFSGVFGDVRLYAETGDVVVNPGLVANSITAEAAGDVGIGSQFGKADVTTYHQLLGTHVTVWNDGDFTVDGDVGRAGGVVTLIAANGTLTQAAGTIFGSDISLRATNSVLQSSAASVQADIGGVFLGDSGADLKLLGTNRLEFNSFNWGANATVTIRSLGDLHFDTVGTNPSNPAIGALTLISDTGNVDQWGSFNAASLNVQAHGDITLYDQYSGTANKVGSVTGLTSATGSISFKEDNGFTIDGNISAAAGNVSLSSGGAIEPYSGKLSLGGTLAVTAGGDVSFDVAGNIRLGAVDTTVGSGGKFYLGGDSDIALTGAVNTGTHDLILYTNGGAITRNGGTVSNSFPATTYATASGGIDLAGAGGVNIWATSTGGGDIHLSGDSYIGFSVNTTGDVTIDSGGSVGNSGDVIAHSLGINAGNGISVYGSSATVNVGSYRYLTTAAGQLEIQTPGDIHLDGDVTVDASGNADWIHLQSTSGSILQNSGKIAGGYAITLDAAQSITQNTGAQVISNGPGGFYFTGTDVILAGANQIDAISSYTVSHDFTLRNAGDIQLWGNTVTSTGDWNLTSDTGSISGVILAHKLTATATNGFIRFNDGNSEIAELGALTAKSTGGDNDVYIYSNTLLNLTGNITAGGVKLYAASGINQTGGAITADRLWTGTSGSLLIGGANNFGTLTEAFHPNGGTVTIRNRGDITLPGAQNSFGTLTLTSDQGKISQTDAITVATLVAQAATGIDLSNTSNNFTTLNGLSTTTGNIAIGDTGGFAIERDITAATGTVALTSTGAITTGTTTVGSVVTPHGKIDADTLTVNGFSATLYAKDDIKLGNSSVSNGLTITADHDLDLAGTINASASLIAKTGAITQSGGSWNSGVFGAASAAGDITLLQGNRFGTFNAQSSGGGTIRLNNANSAALNLGLTTSGSAAVTTAGALSSSGITVDSLSASANAIDLTSNVNVNRFTGLAAAGGDIRVTVAHGFTIEGDVTASKATGKIIDLWANGGAITQTTGTISAYGVTLRATGNVTQASDGKVDANATTLGGANLYLTGANRFGLGTATAIDSAGTVQLRGDGLYLQFLNPAGNVTLTATAGDIQLTSDGLTASSLTANASGAIQMSNGTSHVGTIHGLSGTNISFTGDAFTIDGDITADAATGIVSLTADSGNLSQAAGTISGAYVNLTSNNSSVLQDAAAKVVAGSGLAVTSAHGDIALKGANDFNGTNGSTQFIYGSGKNVWIHNLGSIAFTGGTVGALNLFSDNGAITQAGAITAASLNAGSGTGVTLNTSGNAIDTVGTLNGGTGNVTLKTANALTLTGDIGGNTVTLTGASTIVQNAGAITANNFTANGTALAFNGTNYVSQIDVLNASAGSASFMNRSGILIGGHVSATQDVSLTSQIGAIGGAGYVSANALNLSSARNITLDNAANAFSSLTLYAMAGDVSLTNHNGFQIAAGGVNADIHSVTFDLGGGALTAFDANSKITAGRLNLTGNGSNATVYGGATFGLGDITLGTGTLDVTVAGNQDLALGGDILARIVSLSSGGTITQSSGVVTTGTLNLSSHGAIFFDSANNVAGIGAVDTHGPGDFAFRNAGDLVLTGAVTVNKATLNSNTGSVTGSGLTANTLVVDAATGINLSGSLAFLRDLTSATGGIDISSSSGVLNLYGNINSGLAGTTLSAAGITQTLGIITAGALTISSTGDVDLTKANQVQSTGTISTGTNFFHFANAGGFNVGGSIIAGNVELTAGGTGSITQTSSTVAAATLTATAGGDISFDRANSVGLYNAQAGTGRTITLRNYADLVVKAITAQDGTVNLTSNTGSVGQQVVPGNSIWTGTLNANAAAGIDLSQYNYVNTLGNLSAADSIRYNSAGTLMLGGNIRAGGTLAMNVGGYIGQLTGTIAADHLDLNATGIALMSANDIGSTNASNLVATDDITFHSANAILLGNVSTSGLLSLTADSGDVRQIAAFAADRLDVSAVAGDIVLDRVNSVSMLNDVTAGGSFRLGSDRSLTLDGRISAPGLVKLSIDGSLIQTGTTGIFTDALEASATAGLSLLNHNHVGQVSLDGGGHDVRFHNVGAIAINSINAAGATIELISDTGAITQSDPVNGALIGSLIVNAAGGATLLGRDNQIAHLDVISGGDVSIASGTNGYGGIMTVDRIAAAGRRVWLANSVAAINGGNITADYLYLFGLGGDLTAAANNVGTLNAHTPAGNLAFTNTGDLLIDGIVTNGATDVTLRSEQGAITQANNAIVTIRGLTAYGRDGVYLGGAIDRIDGLSAASDKNVTVFSSHALDIAGDITAGSATLQSNSAGGAINQSAGTITVDRLYAGASGAISLERANRIGEITGLSSLNGATISLTTQGDLALNGFVTGGDLNFDTGTGRLRQVSGTLSGGRVAVTAGDVVLDGANTVSEYYLASTGDATLRAAGALRIGGQADSMTVRAGGAITQLSALFVGSLDASTTSGGISLNLANRIDTIAGLGGSDVFVHNVVDLDIAGDVNGGSQAYFLVDGSRIVQSAGTISAGNVTFSAGAGIDQASTAKIIASSFNGTAGAGLSLAGANQIDSATLSTSSGNLLFRNSGSLDAAAFTSPGDLTLISDTGSITQSAALSIGGTASFSAAGDITLANGGNSFLSLGLISAGGNLDLRATNLTLTDDVTARNIWLQTTGGISQQGGIVTADGLGGISNGGIALGNANQIASIGELRARAGDLTLHVTGDVSLTNAVAAAGNLVTLISDTGGITQANNPDAVIYGSRLNASAGGDITLGGANQFGVLSLTLPGSATVNTVGNLMLADTIDVGGDLSLTSGGRITSHGVTGGVTGTLTSHAQGGIAIAFNSGDVGAFGDQITASGDVSLLSEHVRLTGRVTASGAFSVQATSGSVTQAAGSVITAASADGSATGDLLLGGDNTIGRINGLSAAGDLAFKTSGGIQIAGALTAGSSATMTLIAGGDIDNGGTAAVSGGTLIASAAGHWVQFYGNGLVSFGKLGDTSADNFILNNNGAVDLVGNVVVTSGMVVDATGAITQSDGSLTVRSLSLYGRGGVTADRENHVVRLQGNTYSSAAFRFTNAGDLTVLGNIGSGDVTLNVDGDLTANAGIGTLGVITLNANGIQTGELWGNDVIVNGGAHDVRIGRILSQDDVSVTGTGYVSVGSLDLLGGTDVAGDGYNVRISGGDVLLGAASGAITASNYLSYGAGVTPGSVAVLATGNATVGVTDANAAIGISAAGDVHAESINQLRIDGASGANVTLIAGTDLTLSGNFLANGALTATATAGDVLGASARLGAGLTTDGALTVNGGNIALLEASGNYDVTLNGTGAVDIGLVYVGRSYTLKGASFLGAALTPVGTRTGDWSLTSLGDLDLGGTTLEYPRAIDFQIDGLLSNGTIRSAGGAVTGSAGTINLYELLGATGVDVSTTTGGFEAFHVDGGTGIARIASATAIDLTGSIEAGGDVHLSTGSGGIATGYASAGGSITLYAQGGNAVLRQAKLTGAAGDLLVQSTSGDAVLGADNYPGVGNDTYFERAAGATGNARILGSTGAFVNLDHSAALTQVMGADAAVNLRNGDLSIDTLTANAGTASAYLGNGALTVNTASGDTVDLQAMGGNLVLGGGGITANDLYLTSNRVVDTTAVSLLEAGNYLEIDGGEVRAASLGSGGDLVVNGDTGGIAIDALRAGRDASVVTTGNLAIDRISLAGGGQFAAGGTATVRSLAAADGFALVAQGNVVLGADAGVSPGSHYSVETGGTLGGCGCGSGGGTVASLGGDVSINLFSVTGVLDAVSAAAGDVGISIGSGDLGINFLQGHNIAASVPGVLTVTNVESGGGSYSLTAADFGGLALSPTLSAGATRLGDVTIIDTDGDLSSAGFLQSSGNIRVEARGGAITGALTLIAAGDVTAIGRGVGLQYVSGRDVTIDAGTGIAAISSYLSVDRDYTVTAGDFAGNVLAVNGARAGALRITDTVGDFDFGANGFAFGGAIRIDALHGALRVGALDAGAGILLNGSGVSAGMLRADQGGIEVASSQGIDIDGAHALDSIRFQAGGNLRLGEASLSGTGANILALGAGGDLVFGAADQASILGSSVFRNLGTPLSGTSIQADGAVAINFYRADALAGIRGGTVQLAVSTGDFSAGAIRAVGAIAVQGPSGSLALGNLTSSAGHIDVAGQGNTTLGDVSGNFVVNLLSGAGNLAFGNLGGGDVQLTAAGGITGASVSAGTLGVVAIGGNADLDHNGTGSHVGSLGSVTIGNGDFLLRNLQDLSLDGVIDVNGVLDLQVAGALTQNAYYIVADRLQGSVTGAAVLGGGNSIGALGNFSSNGLKLGNSTALAIDGLVQGNAGAVTIASHGGMTITANGRIASSAGGDAITLSSDGRFLNLAGAGALATPNGRWLIYTQTGGNSGHSDPNNDFGGLAGTSYYGAVYDFGAGSFTTAPNAGNRFVYGYRPVLTVTPDSFHVTYNGAVPVLTATITGLVNGDSGSAAWSGAAALSGARRDAGTYAVYSALGSLASDMNYAFGFGMGTVVVDPRVISAILTADSRIYDGTTNATGSLALSGLIDGDQVAASGVLAFDSKNAGRRVATASGITLSGADAGNYVVNTTATALADILAKTITATLSANSRTYDGTTNATGSLTLNGLIGNDQAAASGTLAFDSKNAGTRTVTASGITLSGADAGNYVVSGTATALADILAKAITATLTANGRTYDGTTNATGNLALNGVIGGDQVAANGTLAFDNKNAGIGRTVTASGIALSGADAGNYTVGTTATALADILAKTITATLTANGRTYDGTTAATGTLGLNGVVAGDTVSVGSTGMAFDSRNAGVGRTVTASGITLSGADAGNYAVSGTATALADILAKAITATLTANGRVYDGTTAATGTLGLNGVVLGDQVGVSAGSIAFDSKNAGSRTATASGLALNGADAANYTISGTATGAATIAQRAITATATADSRAYDGTTGTTGRIALTGVISGDAVTGTATYRFADANAGTGRAVQVSGLALTGVDAGNYAVSLSGAPVIADITRRAVTVTAQDATKLFGQPDPVFGYAVSTGSLVNGDGFTGALARIAGEQVGSYAIGQGTLALSANYLLTVIPGTLVISFTRSGADASDALRMLRVRGGSGFSLDQNPSRNLEGDGEREGAGDGDK